MRGKRSFDIVLASVLSLLFLLPMIMIAVWVRLSSKGPALYWSDRVGKNNRIFKMPKFRSMSVHAPVVATHLLTDSANHITSVGKFLRKTSLDELPQLYSILLGHMSFVGPRPALFNQYDLIELRTTHRIQSLLPGITGWAQINGRDELDNEKKVKFDLDYKNRQSFLFDGYIIFKTITKVLYREGIDH